MYAEFAHGWMKKALKGLIFSRNNLLKWTVSNSFCHVILYLQDFQSYFSRSFNKGTVGFSLYIDTKTYIFCSPLRDIPSWRLIHIWSELSVPSLEHSLDLFIRRRENSRNLSVSPKITYYCSFESQYWPRGVILDRSCCFCCLQITGMRACT